jgi:hypothetical protein
MAVLTVLSGIFGFLTGPISKFFDYRTQRAIVEGKVQERSILADIELNRIKKEMHVINQGWWATRWIVPGFAYPLIVWWGAVILDSLYQFPNWNVAALPPPLDEWAGAIIMSFFAVRGVEVVGNAIGRATIITSVMDGVRAIFRKEK